MAFSGVRKTALGRRIGRAVDEAADRAPCEFVGGGHWRVVEEGRIGCHDRELSDAKSESTQLRRRIVKMLLTSLGALAALVGCGKLLQSCGSVLMIRNRFSLQRLGIFTA